MVMFIKKCNKLINISIPGFLAKDLIELNLYVFIIEFLGLNLFKYFSKYNSSSSFKTACNSMLAIVYNLQQQYYTYKFLNSTIFMS